LKAFSTIVFSSDVKDSVVEKLGEGQPEAKTHEKEAPKIKRLEVPAQISEERLQTTAERPGLFTGNGFLTESEVTRNISSQSTTFLRK